jgi:hypothetical protein
MLARKIVLVLLAMALSGGACAAELRIPLASGGAIVFQAPDDWKWSQVENSKIRTIELVPVKGDAFSVQVTPMVKNDGTVAGNKLDGIRLFVQKEADDLKAQAKVAQVELQELHSATVQGYYYSLTDQTDPLPPGEFKYLTQGSFVVGGIPVVFTILGRGDRDSISAPALEMLKGARKE